MKIRIRKLRVLSFDSFMMFVALLAISSMALLEHVSVPIPTFSALKFPMLYVGAACLMTRINLFLKSYKKVKYFYILLMVVLVCGLLGVSAYENRVPDIGINPMRITIRMVLYLAEVFLLAIWIAERGRCKSAMNFLFWYVLVLVAVTDVLLFSRIMVFHSGKYENYLIGTKFSVSYMHMNLLTLWFMRNNQHFYRKESSKWLVLLIAPFILAVSIRVDCMTGVVGCLLLFVLFMMLNNRYQRSLQYFTLPSTMWAFLIGIVLFPFLAERIVSVPFISNIVENILGRDLTLTGRLVIFEKFGAGVSGHWNWGFGFGNGNAAAEQLFNCANAQNAQLHWILQAGFIVTFFVNALLALVIKQLSGSTRKRQIMPLVILVYVYIILGTVETTFSMAFFLWVACIFMHVNEKTKGV